MTELKNIFKNDVCKFNMFVSVDPEHFVEEINKVGLDYLEQNRIFCILFVHGDPEQVINYREVLDKIDPLRISNRIFERSYYLPSIEDEVVNSVVDLLHRSIQYMVCDPESDNLNIIYNLKN